MEKGSKPVKENSNTNSKTKEGNIRCAVANITEAVATIVSHSTNDEFRQKCFSLVKVSNSSGLVSSLPSQLHSIAHRHMGVTLSADDESPSKESPEKPVVTNSQPTASQCEVQYNPPSQSTGTDDASLDDEFCRLSQFDCFRDQGVTRTLESSQLFNDEVESASIATSSMEPAKSVEVLHSKPLHEDEWFDEVLDSDPFFNES